LHQKANIAYPVNAEHNDPEVDGRVLQKIIPDMVIDGQLLGFSFDTVGSRVYGGCKTLVDVKTKTCDAKYPIAEGKVASAVERRATEASREYLTRARRLDADLDTPAGTKGPFELELEAYGKGGRVIIPVVGALGEMSSDVYSIVDLWHRSPLMNISRTSPKTLLLSRACFNSASTGLSVSRHTSAGPAS
jgi:hypothetical protein